METPPPETPVPSDSFRQAAGRAVAILEVLICSDFPTQFALGATLVAFGFGPYGANGHLQVNFVVALSLLDSLLLVGLILLFLYAHGERPRDVLFGWRPLASEARFGLPLIVVAIGIAAVVLTVAVTLVPGLHTVKHNPLQELLRSPKDAWLFVLVVIAAGGVREEVQRAFLVHRFESSLGGGTVGVVVTSLAFGVGHIIQGADAAIATGALGAFWGFIYLRRRSIVAPMVSHAGFDLLQIAQFVAVGR